MTIRQLQDNAIERRIYTCVIFCIHRTGSDQIYREDCFEDDTSLEEDGLTGHSFGTENKALLTYICLKHYEAFYHFDIKRGVME